MPKHSANRSSLILLAALLCALWASAALAQTAAFTYQGQLNDNGNPANGPYDLQLRLFDAAAGGTQQGPALGFDDVQVSNGIFKVTPDFGAAAFTGGNRWLEISLRAGASTGAFTTLSPRQQLTSTPYSVRSLLATSADGLSLACVNCVTSSQIGSLPTGSANYIQNTATLQASSNFNISGNGLIGNRLGIGTTSPTRKLTVQTAAALGEAGFSHTNGTVEVGTYVNSGGGWLQTHTNHPLFFTTNNLAAQMTLTTAGNIGIGTTTPADKLTVLASGYGLTHTDGVVTVGSWLGSFNNQPSGWYGTKSNHPLHFFVNGGNPSLTVGTNSRVGIGTITPGFPLTFPDSVGDKISLWGQSGAHYGFGIQGSLMQIHTSDVSADVAFGYGTSAALTETMRVKGNGNVGIGTTAPTDKLTVRTGTASYGLTHTDGIATVGSWVGGFNNQLSGWLGTKSNHPLHLFVNGGNPSLTVAANTNVGIGTTTPTEKLQVAGNGLFNGTLKTNVLQILGGSDLSEQFDIHPATSATNAASPADIQPGLVVSIDPENPGKLVVSHEAYDRKVAGIISGAGGVKTGMLMGQTGSVADGGQPVALTGRVYCWVDTTNGPILPGDLLTTSSIPGHAMKATDHDKAQGAIIGKAMTSLKEGRGLVLVLVSLQ